MSKIYTSVRNHTIEKKVKLINSLVQPKGTLLDIGCGTGNFLTAVKLDGWKAFGTEPDSGAAIVASKSVGGTVFESIFEDESRALRHDRHHPCGTSRTRT